MRVNILGAPELLGAEQEVPVQSKLWCVILSLILRPGVPVQLEDLVDQVWGTSPPERARSTLRTYIRRVEIALSQAAGHNMRITRRSGGYALDISSRDVDLHRFRELRDRADMTTGAAAITLFKQAESLWRGEALAGLDGDWASGIRFGLNEELRSVIARRVDLELSHGRQGALLPELAELTERYPMDETFAAQRMLALFRAGRQTDALRVHQRIKSLTVGEGLDPDPMLQDLFLRILRRDPGLRIERQQRPVNTLPPETASFVGRAQELAAVLASSPGRTCIRVIEGMGGIGKTALAVHAAQIVADRFPDGQLYLNLRRSGHELDPADALHDLLGMLGVAEIGGKLDERRQQWLDELATRRVAVVLDDAVGPEQVRPLIAEDADCLILVTSRRHVKWEMGETFRLEPLPRDDAVRLFDSVAGTDLEPKGAAEVARVCGGLPLAIKIVAAHAKTSAMDYVLRELADRDGVPEGVGAIFDASYRGLPADVRRLFRYLAVSPCVDFTAATAAPLADVTMGTVSTLLDTLDGHCLLEERAAGRFSLHEVVRAYAGALSRAVDTESEVMTAMRRLVDYYTREAERASETLRSRERVPGMRAGSKAMSAPSGGTSERAWLAAEYENIILLAEYYGKHERKRQCARLVRAISDFLGMNGHWEQARRAHEFARRACRDTDDTYGNAEATHALSLMCLRTGRLDDAFTYASEAKTLFGRAGDRHGQAEATDRLGVVCRHQARFRASLAYHEEAIDISRASGDHGCMGQAMFHAATALHMLGRLTEEMAYLAEALGISRQRGDLRSQGLVHNSIGLVYLSQGYHRHATASFQASHEIFRSIGGRQNLAVLEHNMGKVRQYRASSDQALAMYRKALAEFRSMGDLRDEALVRADIGSVLRESQSYAAAVVEYERALAISELMGDRYAYVLALCGMADTKRESDELAAALELYERAERIAAQIEAEYPKALALHGMGEAMLLRSDEDAARIYWREALGIYDALGSYLTGIVTMRLERFFGAA